MVPQSPIGTQHDIAACEVKMSNACLAVEVLQSLCTKETSSRQCYHALCMFPFVCNLPAAALPQQAASWLPYCSPSDCSLVAADSQPTVCDP